MYLQPTGQNKGESDSVRGHSHEMGVGLVAPSSLNPKSIRAKMSRNDAYHFIKLESGIR